MVRDGNKRKEIMEEDSRHSFQFVRIAFAGRSSDPLRIPSDFLNHISNGLSNRATLKVDSAGRSWDVKVSERSSGGIFIEDGWKQFIRDNSLGNNEFLLFTYEGSMCFDIKIFEVDGHKRVEAPLISARQPSASISSKRQGGRTRKKAAASTLKLHPSKSCDDGSGPCCESHKPKRFKSGKGCNQTKIEPEDDVAHRVNFQSTDHTARDWKAAAESFKSMFPHFSRPVRRNQIYVPLSFSRAHFPYRTVEIVLRNLKEKSWVVYAIPIRGGHIISKGWFTFVGDNKLNRDDVCIFELVDKHKHEMKVHIYRNGRGG